MCRRLALLAIAGTVVMMPVTVDAQGPEGGRGGPLPRRLGGEITAPKLPDAPAPRLPDGKPDMTGAWTGSIAWGNIIPALKPGETVELLPEARKKMAGRMVKDDPAVKCILPTPPRGAGFPWRIVITPTHAFILYEFWGHYRQVFLDGRRHPPLEEINPTWMGHSIGSWQGDTLVIDTIGFNDLGWLDGRGHPVSEKLHVIERYTRTKFGTMRMEATIDDPGSYAKPFTLQGEAELIPDGELLEYACSENNQDAPYLEGPADTRGRN